MNEQNESRENESRARQNPNYCPPHPSSLPYNPTRIFEEVIKICRRHPAPFHG